jgi:hypothetical protein
MLRLYEYNLPSDLHLNGSLLVSPEFAMKSTVEHHYEYASGLSLH